MKSNMIQIQELANAISNQADAIAEKRLPDHRWYAQALRLRSNVDMLVAWTKAAEEDAEQ